MPACKQRIAVASKLEDAFEYVADWKNISNFLPMFVSISPTTVVQYGPGASFDITISIARTEISTSLDVVEFFKNRRIVMKSNRGIRMKIVWEFKDVGGKVLVTFEMEYDIPQGLVVRGNESESLSKDMEATGCKSMELLKWILESLPPSTEE
jgi:ribosome-associated toxin RatA of RatAB toxin-antitoxin module